MSRFVANPSPLPDSMLGPLRSDGAAIGAIRSPPGVIGSNLTSPRRGRLYMRLSVRVLGPYRKFSTTVNCNACWPARKTVAACAGGASLIPISAQQGRNGRHGYEGCEPIEKMGRRLF